MTGARGRMTGSWFYTSLVEDFWVGLPISQLIIADSIEMNVVTVLLAWSDCVSQEVFAVSFTVALAALVAVPAALEAHHSSAYSTFLAMLLNQGD